jgi:hypothetical protein
MFLIKHFYALIKSNRSRKNSYDLLYIVVKEKLRNCLKSCYIKCALWANNMCVI